QSLMAVQRRFRTQYGRGPPTRKNIRFWYKNLRTIGIFLLRSPGKTRTSEENIRRITQRGIVHDVLHKSLHLRAYRIQTIHALTPSDQVAAPKWACLMQKLLGPFLFSEKSVTGRSYLDMLKP
ncbi:hypothetical protein B7P43_G03794, partial [Cryptotermes secundus]